MKTVIGTLTLFVLMLFAVEGQAQVQPATPPGNIFFTIDAGGFFPTTDLGNGELDNTGTVNATLGTWLGDYLGVRANVLWANPDVIGDAPEDLQGQSPDIWHYSGDVLLRFPFEVGQGTLMPYAIGGLGARTMTLDGLSNQTDFAGNFGGGLEYRFGAMQQFGVNTEVRGFGSNFEAFGVDETLWDVTWTGGLTFAF